MDSDELTMIHHLKTLPTPLAAALLVLLAALTTAAGAAGAERQTLTPAQVACDRAQLGALLARMRLTGPGGAPPSSPQILFVSYANRFGFYDGMVVGRSVFRPAAEPPVVPRPTPGPEHQLGFHLNPSVRELLLNPERAPLEQVSLTREASTSNLVEPGGPFEVILEVNPTLGGHGSGDLVIDNLSAPRADGTGVRPADTKPGRGLAEAGLTDLCHARFTELDRKVFSILQRTLRPDVFDMSRNLRYDTQIAIFRGEDPEVYRADVYLVDPESGVRHPVPLEARIRVVVDGSDRLTDGHLNLPVHALPNGPNATGVVAIARPLFGGVDSESIGVVAYPVGGPVPAAPESFWDFDWRDVLEDTAWNEGSTPGVRSCGQGTAEEIAATPRAAANLEHLARDMGGGLTADQAIYERVVADVGAIRTGHPELPVVDHRGAWRPDELILSVAPDTYRLIADGRYEAWDCLNDWYDVAQVRPAQLSEDRVLLAFDGVYDVPVLAADYAALPGVTAAEPNGWGADGSDLCGSIDGATYRYVVRVASGDCPAGCIDEELTLFTSEPGEAPVLRETWNSDDGTPRPAWAAGCGR